MSFKDFLNEEKELLLEFGQYNMSKLIASRAIPLEAGMMDRLGYLEKDKEVFHLTNSKHLSDIKKNSKSKHIQLSTFTQGGPELARLPSQPNVLLKLKGTTLIEGETDIWTTVGKHRNRRWIEIGDYWSKDKTKLEKYIDGILQKIANKIGLDVDIARTTPEQLEVLIDGIKDNLKVSLYRDYMKGLENLLNKEYKLLNNFLKTAAEMSYNELVLTDYTIIYAQSVNFESPDVLGLFDKLNIKNKGVISSIDIAKIKKG